MGDKAAFQVVQWADGLLQNAVLMLSRRDMLVGAGVLATANFFRPMSVFAKAAQPATPVNFLVPKDACDCHVHVFGDPRRFPLAAARTYTPESASVDELRALHRALHLDRVVIIQPSVYGTDNSCMLDALKQIGSDARGIACAGCRGGAHGHDAGGGRPARDDE